MPSNAASRCPRNLLQDAIDRGTFSATGVLGQPDMKIIVKSATELARGISYLHQSNIIHSDLSGSSIFLCTDPDGQGITLKVRALSAVWACSS